MRAAAGMVSAAMLLAPACGEADRGPPTKEEPVRRAAYLSAIARDVLASCPGGPGRGETRVEGVRHAELKQLAALKDASHAIWLGENDHAGLSRLEAPRACGAGEAGYRAALVDYRRNLDALAARIAEYRP